MKQGRIGSFGTGLLPGLAGRAATHGLSKANPQVGHIQLIRIILKMFHVKHFCPIRAQNLTSRKTALRFDLVTSRNFLVRSESGGGAVSMAHSFAKVELQCKIHS
jgi:hypothetical protein